MQSIFLIVCNAYVSCCRYLTSLRLTLIKKKAVSDWKAEQLHAKKQLHEEVLGEVVQPADDPNASLLSGQDSGAGGDGAAAAAGTGHVVTERERDIAKARIAKWKADQITKAEQEKVRFFEVADVEFFFILF